MVGSDPCDRRSDHCSADRKLIAASALRIAILKERAPGETRVAATPETVKKFLALGAGVAGRLRVTAAGQGQRQCQGAGDAHSYLLWPTMYSTAA